MTLRVKDNDLYFQYQSRVSQDACLVQIWGFQPKFVMSYCADKSNVLEFYVKWPKWPWRSRSMTSIFNTSREYPRMHVLDRHRQRQYLFSLRGQGKMEIIMLSCGKMFCGVYTCRVCYHNWMVTINYLVKWLLFIWSSVNTHSQLSISVTKKCYS